MKVLAINGSPHPKGCTYTALSLVTEVLEDQGIKTEPIHIGSGPIRGCTACGTCRKNGRCVYDDIVNACLEKVKSADGFIIGSPVYYSGIAGPMKSFLDRFFYAGPDLRYKVGAAVVSLRRSGDVDVFHQLNNYLNLANVVIAPSRYWNSVHGNTPDEVMEDKEGVQIMQTLGRNMAWLLKVLDRGRDIPHAEEPSRVFTNFIR